MILDVFTYGQMNIKRAVLLFLSVHFPVSCISRGDYLGEKTFRSETRPDTRPSVADGWAGAEKRVFPLFDSMVTGGRTDGPTD